MNWNFWHREKTIFGLTRRDIEHHAILVVMLLIGIGIFALVSYSRILQFATGVVIALCYVLWGYIHHKLDGDYHIQNMVEYVFIALLSILILGGIYL